MKKNIYYFVMGIFALLGTVSCSKSESEESAKYQNLPQEVKSIISDKQMIPRTQIFIVPSIWNFCIFSQSTKITFF